MYLAPSAITVSAIVVATAVSAGVTCLLLRSHSKIGMDSPDERRKSHAAPVPRIGGLPIFIALAFGFIFASLRTPGYVEHWWPVMLTCTLIFLVGFADDLRPLGARVKLLGQIGAACILYAFGVSIDDLSNPFGEGHLYLGLWSFPLTILWLIAIPNIINLIDGMDGLASGFGLFLCVTLGFVGHMNGRPEVVFIAAVMSGALGGFLIFNYPPARIFLGDGGAYLIGFFIASTSLVSATKGSILAALLVMIVALGVPILDTFFAIARRALRGVPIFRADAEHIHHRLILLGFSKTRALIALYSVSVALSLIGISIFISKGLALPVAGAALCLLALGAARYLGYVKSWSQLTRQMQGAMERRRDMLFTHTCGRVVDFEAERCATAEEFALELRHALERAGLRMSASAETKPLPLQLSQNVLCRLHYVPDSPQSHERWLAKADAFVPALNRAVERWGSIPGLDVHVQQGGNGSSPARPLTLNSWNLCNLCPHQTARPLKSWKKARASPDRKAGAEPASPPRGPVRLWLTLAVPIFACGFAGSKEPWALGGVATLVALNLVLVRPSIRAPRTVVWPLMLASLLMLSAFLPQAMSQWPEWRLRFTEDFGVTLPKTNSPQPWISLEAWILAMVGFSWLWTCFGRGFDQAERRWLMRRLVIMVAALAVIAIVVRNNDLVVPFWRSEWLSGYFGPFPDRNNFSGFLAMGAVLAFAAAYDAWRRRSIFWLVVAMCVVCIVWALVSNTSRAGVLLFFGGIMAWMTFASFSRRSAQRIGISTSVVLVFAAFFVLFGKPILDRMHGPGGVIQTLSNENRFQIAHDAVRLISQSSWHGVGLGNFNAAFAFTTTFVDPYSRPIHPEDDWLWLASECGPPVLILFLLAFLAWWLHTGSWNRGKDGRSGQRDRRLRNACAIAVIMIAVHGLVDVPGHSVGVPFTMILVASLALRPRLLVSVERPSLFDVVMRYGAMALCAFAALMWFSVSWDQPLFPGNSVVRRLVKRGEALATRGDLAGSLDAFNRVLAIKPLQWDYYFQRAEVELPLGEMDKALEDFSRMRYLEPHNAIICMDEAQLWLRYHPAYALPALREAMKRLKERSAEFYSTVLAALYDPPELRSQMRDLASDPKLKLVYLYSSSGEDFTRGVEDLLEQDPKLSTLTPEERRNFFNLWYQRGDRARLLRMMKDDPVWRADGWSILAADLAAKGNYEGAWRLAEEQVPPPVSTSMIHSGDLVQLRRDFLLHPADANYGLELYEMEKSKGLFDDALVTLAKLSHLPDAPKRLIYEEGVILARKGDYAHAWEKMNQYIQSSR